jgi:hypothetical protein
LLWLDAVSDASDECYTPGEHLELARDVLGRIDLDPASNETAQRLVRAARFFTIDDDGLAQEWTGRVWLNCPYSKPAPWVLKLLAAYNAGAVTASVALFNANLASRWFHTLTLVAWRCEPFKRIPFWGPAATHGGGRAAQVFFYLGSNPDRFAAVFSKIGRIYPPAGVTLSVTQGRGCAVCSRSLAGKRADASTCSARCRRRLCRRRAA